MRFSPGSRSIRPVVQTERGPQISGRRWSIILKNRWEDAMDKASHFLWIVQTVILANAVHLTSQPVRAKVYQDEVFGERRVHRHG